MPIQFRCWFCNRAYAKPDEQIGTRFECGCGRLAKVPKQSGRSSKVRSLLDWLIESVVYGGTGALIGFVLAVVIFSRVPIVRRPLEVTLAFTAFGFLTGALFGERGINWIGQKLRDRQNG